MLEIIKLKIKGIKSHGKFWTKKESIQGSRYQTKIPLDIEKSLINSWVSLPTSRVRFNYLF